MKNNLNQICLKKYFGQLLLVSVLFLAGVFFTNTSVKAATTITPVPLVNWSSDGWIDGNMIFHASAEIPQHSENSILMCMSDPGENWGAGAGTWTMNGVNSILIMGSWYNFSYIPNPAVGVKPFVFKSSGYHNASVVQNELTKCWLIDGVNLNNLVSYSSPGDEWYSWNVGYDFLYGPASTHSLIFTYLTRQDKRTMDYSGAASTNQNILVKHDGSDYQWSILLAYNTNNTGNSLSLNASGLAYSEMRLRIFELNTLSPVPPCESYSYTSWSACDPDGYQVRNIVSTSPANCAGGATPNLLNTCEFGDSSGNAPDDGTGIFFSNPYSFSFNSTAIVRYDYNENVFTPYDYLEIRKISSDWSTSTFVATSTVVDLSLGKTGGKSFFTLLGNASTTGLTYYDVTPHFSDYWSPTLGDVAATTTIPYVVVVDWHPTEIPSLADILAASSTNPFYDDSAMYDAACSEEEWQTPPPEIFGVNVPALNLTVIGCKFKLGFIIAGNKFTTIVTDGFYRAGNILKSVFPFNIYTNLNSSWKASANATVISELAFLSPV
ncbi:MAG: hypothetical protein ACOYMB_05225, partial [Patescibacteria group bacterium]